MSSLSQAPPSADPSSGSHQTSSAGSYLQSLEGYEYEFDPPVGSRYECPICLLVLREPSQTKCGHRFCKECILRTLKNSSTRCPIDNEPLTEADIYPDNYAKREILNCNIKCPNKDDGCTKVFPLCELKAHLQDCQFTLVPCPNKCGCILPQQDIQNHVGKQCSLRIVMCTCCGANIQAQLTQDHVMVCPKVPVKCEYCHQEMTRAMINHHIQTDCENVTVPCPFYQLGCGTSLKRGSENQHLMEEGAAHFRQLCGAVTHILGEMNQHRRVMEQNDHGLDGYPGPNQAVRTCMNGMIDNSSRLNPDPCLADSITGLKGHLHGPEHRLPIPSSQHPQSLPTGPVGSKIAQKPQGLSLPHLGATPHKTQQEHCTIPPASQPDNASAFPAASTIDALAATVAGLGVQPSPLYQRSEAGLTDHTQTSALPTQQQGRQTQGSALDAASTIPLVFSMIEQVSTAYEQKLEANNKEIAELKTTVSNLKKQNVELSQVVLDLQDVATNSLAKTCSGKFFWTIQGFKGLKQKALKGELVTLHSQPFYTSAWGYKMCLRANITVPRTPNNGAPQQQNLSLFVHVMQGDNDAFLLWPFTGKIMLALLDQNKDKSQCRHMQETLEAKPNLAAFQRPVVPRNQKGFGFIEFMPVGMIEKGTYLADDCLVVHAQVLPNPA